jgi:hypothetical protein
MKVSPILISAKTAVTDMIEKYFDMYLVVIHDLDNQSKNDVLLAIENR